MIEKNFGPLTELLGKWIGTKGWNIIAVPVPGNPDFKLIIQPITEIINVKVGARGPAPNRGGNVGQQNSFALEYELVVAESSTSNRLHIENGMWLHLVDPPGTTNPNPIARQAIVPHGNSVLLMGPLIEPEKREPTISSLDPRPFPIGDPSQHLDLPQYKAKTEEFVRVFGAEFNPNKPLTDVLADQKVARTQTFSVSTENNGGIVNIPFINEHAKATSWETVVWIETLEDGTKQMQYTQTILIDFNGLSWPHIDVNTLTRI